MPCLGTRLQSHTFISNPFRYHSSVLPRAQSARRRQPQDARPAHGVPVVRAGIKAVENFDASFTLEQEADEVLRTLLGSDIFCKQVARETGVDETLTFTGQLFQPVPWSPTSKKGMPQDMEHLHGDPAYVFINVPPNFMFQAKIFKPSRLCAVYKKLSQ